jgi:hypothetical protein
MADRPTGAGDRRDQRLGDAEAQALGGSPRAAPPPLPQAESPLDAVKRLFSSIRHNVNGKVQDTPPR